MLIKAEEIPEDATHVSWARGDNLSEKRFHDTVRKAKLSYASMGRVFPQANEAGWSVIDDRHRVYGMIL